jgi:hypothetical protein
LKRFSLLTPDHLSPKGYSLLEPLNIGSLIQDMHSTVAVWAQGYSILCNVRTSVSQFLNMMAFKIGANFGIEWRRIVT